MRSTGGTAVLLGLALLVGSTNAVAQESMEVYFTLLIKPMCDKRIPDFEDATSDGYKSWRVLNSEAIAAVEGNPGFIAQSEQIAKKLQEQEDLGQDENIQCESLKATFTALSRPVDSGMKSPEGTWLILKEGLKAGDRSLVRKCVTSSAAHMMDQILTDATDEQLRQLGDMFGEIVSTSEYDEMIEATVLADDGRASSVLFHRNINDEWLIASM